MTRAIEEFTEQLHKEVMHGNKENISKLMIMWFYALDIQSGPKYDRGNVSHKGFDFRIAPYEELGIEAKIDFATRSEQKRISDFVYAFASGLNLAKRKGGSWFKSKYFLRFADDYHNIRQLIDEYMSERICRRTIEWLNSRLRSFPRSLQPANEEYIEIRKPLFRVEMKYRGGLNSKRFPNSLRQRFKENGISLPQRVYVSRKGNEWHINDKRNRAKYIVRELQNELSILVENNPFQLATLLDPDSPEAQYYGNTELTFLHTRILDSLCDMLQELWPIKRCAFGSGEQKPVKNPPCQNIFFIGPGQKTYCSKSCYDKARRHRGYCKYGE